MTPRRFYQDGASDLAHGSPRFQSRILESFLSTIESTTARPRIALDLGSGLGANLPVLRRHCSQVVAGDISHHILFSTAQWLASDYNPFHFHVSDAAHLPFSNGVFDLVVCTEVLEHVPDYTAVIGEIRRVLVQGGHTIVSTPNYLSLVGVIKAVKDAKTGTPGWEPWGAHIGGFERFTTSPALEYALDGFHIRRTQGAGYLLAWLYFTPLAKRSNGLPLLGLGRLPLIKKLGMHYYILAQKPTSAR